MTPHGEFELVIGNRQLVVLFLLLMIILGICFSAGYLVARWNGSGNAAPAPLPARVSTEIAFVNLPPGEFVMGYRRNLDDARFETIGLARSPDWSDELRRLIARDCPAHRVKITRPFQMSRCEVSVGQWEAVMGKSAGRDRSPDSPVDNVSWNDVQQFLERLNQRRDGYRYRLPTEAEWEYAARAGTSGADTDEMYDHAWDNPPGERGLSVERPVDTDTPNAWGLFNMLGNASEWVADWYGEHSYRTSGQTDPQGPSRGVVRVVRGGDRSDVSFTVFVWSRDAQSPEDRRVGLGFRCVREPVYFSPTASSVSK